MDQSSSFIEMPRLAALTLRFVLAAAFLSLALPSAAVAGGEAGSAGCANLSPRTGVFTLATVDGNKKSRSYRVQVPGDYQAAHRYALTFVFHGSGGDSAESSSWGLQQAPGAAAQSIFVFPNGVPYQRFGVGWDDTKTGYDMGFFDAMVDELAAGYCVDTNRIFVAGFSWGGDFALALACARGATIRAAAVNSATDEYGSSTNYLTYKNLPCEGTTRPAMRFAHAQGSDSAYPPPLFATTSSLIRSLNSCAATAKAVPSSTPAVSCVSYDGCAKEYVECNFSASIGHHLPPNWASDTWAFFATFQ